MKFSRGFINTGICVLFPLVSRVFQSLAYGSQEDVHPQKDKSQSFFGLAVLPIWTVRGRHLFWAVRAN